MKLWFLLSVLFLSRVQGVTDCSSVLGISNHCTANSDDETCRSNNQDLWCCTANNDEDGSSCDCQSSLTCYVESVQEGTAYCNNADTCYVWSNNGRTNCGTSNLCVGVDTRTFSCDSSRECIMQDANENVLCQDTERCVCENCNNLDCGNAQICVGINVNGVMSCTGSQVCYGDAQDCQGDCTNWCDGGQLQVDALAINVAASAVQTNWPYNCDGVPDGGWCELECVPGYGYISGDTTIYCSTNPSPSWSAPIPFCSPQDCNGTAKTESLLQNNAHLVASDLIFQCGDTLTAGTDAYCEYACDDGFGLVSGSLNLTCGATGDVWNATDPHCYPQDCNGTALIEQLALQQNAVAKAIQGDSLFNCGDTVSTDGFCEFECPDGYGLVSGVLNVACLGANDTWSDIPFCGARDCNGTSLSEEAMAGNALLKPVQGDTLYYCGEIVSTTGYCEFECEQGYGLVSGSLTVICNGPNDDWSPAAPFCDLQDCNGTALSERLLGDNLVLNPVQTDSFYGCGDTVSASGTCDFECASGYGLVSGILQMTCLGPNANWSATPFCSAQDCDGTALLAGARNAQLYETQDLYNCGDTVSVGGTCVFVCDDAHGLVTGEGALSIECLGSNNTWETTAPYCDVDACDGQELIDLAVLHNHAEFSSADQSDETYKCGQTISVGGFCEFTCPENYELHTGSLTVTCIDIGTWDNGGISCRVVPSLRNPAIRSARFSPDGSHIQIEFDLETNKGGQVDESAENCDELFDEAALALFGSPYRCSWSNEQVLMVKLGPQSTVDVGMHVLVTGANVVNADTPSLAFEPADVVVELPLEFEIPIAVVNSPSQVGRCADVALSGDRSIVFTGRVVIYRWSSDCDVDMDLSTPSPYQPVGLSRVPAGTTCRFGLIVENFLGALSLEEFHDVTKVIDDVPVVHIPQHGAVWTRAVGNELDPTIDFQSCDLSYDELVGELSFEWSAVTHIGSAVVFTDVSTNGKRLYIPQFFLDAARDYVFTLRVTLFDVEVESIAEIHVGRSDLEAVISGGDIVTVNAATPITLSANSSVDPDMDQDTPGNGAPQEHLVYHWTCTYFERDVDVVVELGGNIGTGEETWMPCTNVLEGTGANVVLPMEPSRTYNIVLRLRTLEPQDEREAVDDVYVIAVGDDIPQVQINGDTFLHAEQKMSLTGSILNAVDDETYTYEWSETQYDTLNDNDITLFRSTPEDSRNLVLEKGKLQPFRSYTFQLVATDSNDVSGLAAVAVVVDPGPEIGNFLVTEIHEGVLGKQQNDGGGNTALESLYRMEVVAYGSSETYPFLYRFTYFQDGNGVEKALAGPQEQAVSVVRLVPGTLTLRAYVEDRNGGVNFMDLEPPLIVNQLEDICEIKVLLDELLPVERAERDADSALQILLVAATMMNEDDFQENCDDGGIKQRLFEELADIWKWDDVIHTLSQAERMSQALEELMMDPSDLTLEQVLIAMDLVDSIFVAAEQADTKEGIKFTASISEILSAVLSAPLDKGEDAYCDVVMKIQEHLQTLIQSKLGPLLSGEDPAYLEADNILATAFKVDQGQDLKNVTFSDFLTLDVEIDGDPSDANVDTSDVVVIHMDVDSKCFCLKKLCPENGSIVDITINGDISTVRFTVPFTAVEQEQICGETFLEEIPTCRWYDEDTQIWSDEHCKEVGEPTVLEDASRLLTCECTHLTRFAVVKEYREFQADKCHSGHVFPEAFIFVFMILYIILGATAVIQIIRVFQYSGKYFGCSHELSVHVLVVLACACQVIWLILAYLEESVIALAIFLAVEATILYCIFSSVIYSWFSVCHTSWQQRLGTEHSGKAVKWTLIICNVIVFLILLFLMISISVFDVESDAFDVTFTAGNTLLSAISILTALMFIIYGALLIRNMNQAQLTDQQSLSKATRKIFVIALILSLAFACSSFITIVQVAEPNLFRANFIVFHSIYFTLDVIALAVVLVIFWNIIQTQDYTESQTSKTAPQKLHQTIKNKMTGKTIQNAPQPEESDSEQVRGTTTMSRRTTTMSRRTTTMSRKSHSEIELSRNDLSSDSESDNQYGYNTPETQYAQTRPPDEV